MRKTLILGVLLVAMTLSARTSHAASPTGEKAPQRPTTHAKAAKCEKGWVCVFPGRNYVGGWRGTYQKGVCVSPFNPQHRSIINRMSVAVRAYNGTRCTGGWTAFEPGKRNPDSPVSSVMTFSR